MTTEQKAKAYDEALERAKKLQETCDSMAVVGWCEYIFPELKEDKDEKIRKELIENFKWFCGDFPETTKWGKDDNLLVKDIIIWLEKQGHMLDPDKVIEWLKDQACQGWIEDIEVDKFVDQFKQDFGL